MHSLIMSIKDSVTLLLRKNGFTFDEDGSINYPRGGNYHFQQNLILSLYINHALERNGSKFVIKSPVTSLIPELAVA